MKRIYKSEVEKKLSLQQEKIRLEQKYSFSGNTREPFCREAEYSFNGKGRVEIYSLYPGIDLMLISILADRAEVCRHASDSVIEINFCRSGRLGWEMENKSLYLGPGDFSIHALSLCETSVMTLPLGYYEGVTICFDLHAISGNPPAILAEEGITGEPLLEKFCRSRTAATFPGGEEANAIFSGLFEIPGEMRPACYKLRVQELLLYLYRLPGTDGHEISRYQAEQIATVKEIHHYLMRNLDRRIPIEELSRQYLMNTTTLKTLFKEVYGSSVAAHIKEHRMEKAAAMLRETKSSVAEIARTVGYESQSKFTAAFKEFFGASPTIYRKTHE